MQEPARAMSPDAPNPNLAPPSPPGSAAEDPVLLQLTASSLARAVAWFRRALGWVTMGYVISLALTLVALEWWGERIWMLGLFLFAPPQMLLLPLLLLTPVCLLFRWRLVGWHLGAVVLVLFGYMTFRWSRVPPPGPATITAVTFNAGESNRPQFLEFIDREKPDIVLMQDMSGRWLAVAAKLPGTSIERIGQFCFISKFPLSKPTLVDRAATNGQVVAARCETVIAGRPTALYSVHLPTPRRELSRFIGGRSILADLVGRPHRDPEFGSYHQWLTARIEMARGLARVFREEPLPMIIGGDFNTPDHGYIYHQFAGPLTDAFARAGRGWGLTFPGSSHNPLTLFGPWLRLDYFFVGPGWEVTECRPESGRKSQHKAVLARFEPRPIP